MLNSGNRSHHLRQAFLGSKFNPVLVEKDEILGRNQLLQSPTSREPFAEPKAVLVSRATQGAGNIRKECVANVSTLIPAEHGIDGFRELCARAFVDAA